MFLHTTRSTLESHTTLSSPMEAPTQAKDDPETSETPPRLETPEAAPIEPQVAPVKEEPQPKESTSNATRLKTKAEGLSALELKQKIANIVVHPRLKPTPFDLENFEMEPVVTLEYGLVGQRFVQFDDLPLNKRGFKYKPCRPNKLFLSNLYLTADYAPHGVRVSYFDRSSGIACSEAMDAITTQNGWLSARSNVGVREGKWYFEYDILNANKDSDKSHVRIGIARKEASLEAPVGFDGYGYGLRDLNGQKITLSRPKPYMENDEGFTSGDTIGFLIELPSLEEQRKHNEQFAKELHQTSKKRKRAGQAAAEEEEKKLNLHQNIVRDQIPIKYKNALYFEQFEYTPTKQMDHLLNPVTVFGEKAILEKTDKPPTLPTIPKSKITMFKNGKSHGTMFENLYSFLPLNGDNDTAASDANTKQQQNPAYRNTDDGSLGYYPMMSAFLNGVVRLNPGPDFKFPVPQGSRPLCERYEERVVEEWLYDLVDEVEADYLDSFE